MKRWVPTREQILGSRWLRPFARHLQDERLWHFNRQSVARGVAIGLFFGFLLPFAQFIFAVVTAIVLRAHVALAAAFTLVTNPFTFPPVYWFAHRLGSWMLGERPAPRAAEAATRELERIVEQPGWLEAGWHWLQAAGGPLMLGLATLACCSSLLGYAVVWLLWRQRRTDAAAGDDPPG